VPALTNILEAAAYFPFVFLLRQISEKIEIETFEVEQSETAAFEQDETSRYYPHFSQTVRVLTLKALYHLGLTEAIALERKRQCVARNHLKLIIT
jgi:hypothetical protein